MVIKIIGWVIIVLFYFYLGVDIMSFIPFVKLKKLSDEQKVDVMTKGIVHATTDKGRAGISEMNTILPTKGIKNYCNRLRKSVYFSPAESKTSEGFNKDTKYTQKLKVLLTDEQVRKLKYRSFDDTYVYTGPFFIEEENNITWEEYTVKKVPRDMKSTIIYAACLVVSYTLSAILIFVLVELLLMLNVPFINNLLCAIFVK